VGPLADCGAEQLLKRNQQICIFAAAGSMGTTPSSTWG
jgi:hypothetical protein